MNNAIVIELLEGLHVPSRLLSTISWYLLSLMYIAEKHTQVYASKISGKASSLFSNLLINHLGLSRIILNRVAKRRLGKLMKKRGALVKNSEWTIAIIIDATLHQRSSRHIENVQKFNHGKGWMLGHQWTNIGVLVAGQYVPFPPIPFYTKDECKKRKIKYKTQNDKLIDLLRTLSLSAILGDHDTSEIVFLMDAGYDCRKLHKTILKRGWNFVSALKRDSTISTGNGKWIGLSEYFGDGRRSWKTVRVESNCEKRGKWRTYATKQLVGSLKGIKKESKLVCSKKSKGKDKFFICSNPEIDVRTILSVYSRRWVIELFHRAIKSYLGFEDAGVESFDTLNSHVHWVYCAYILLHDFDDGSGVCIKEKQIKLEAKIEAFKMNKIIQKSTQFNGQEHVKTHCRQVIEDTKRRFH